MADSTDEKETGIRVRSSDEREKVFSYDPLAYWREHGLGGVAPVGLGFRIVKPSVLKDGDRDD